MVEKRDVEFAAKVKAMLEKVAKETGLSRKEVARLALKMLEEDAREKREAKELIIP